ncbi:MAG TPA: PadR family transcriptional regulator [Thermoanaerobaculia bacterium]|nr:PadR family transcriptional regulator [Thermoanaerobaculia bacterium]
MGKRQMDLLQGTLDMLVLKALIWGPRHGYEVMRWVRQVSEGGLQIEEGALYPSLHRIQARGWVEAEWGVSETGRQAKFYTLTAEGRKQFEEETASWKRYVDTVARVLEAEA